MTLSDLNALPIDERPIAWDQTGVPLSRLAGFVARNNLDDPRGGMIEGKLYCYVDWRLHRIQDLCGVARTKIPE